MNNIIQNPFTTIKANDLDDSQINDQWVDLEEKKFIEYLEPNNNITQYIIGGKGTGKTHLMRYFSYKSQSIRNKKSPLQSIRKDGYFGVYFQASSLNGSKFDQLPYSIELKQSLFEYSMELWCAGLVIQSLIDLSKDDRSTFDSEDSEKTFCKEILELFSEDMLLPDTCKITDLIKLISFYSNELDNEVNNSFISELLGEKPTFRVRVNRGKLIFGIPKILSKHSKYFHGTTFIYLIDEIENISESQQMYLNTLVREKTKPVTFRIGARSHGIKSWEIFGSGEVNREGHEFEILRLDEVFITSKKYNEFATNLVFNRLVKSNIYKNTISSEHLRNLSYKEKKKIIDNFFEEVNINSTLQNPHINDAGNTIIMNKFISKLNKKLDNEISQKIANNIKCHTDLRIEQAAIHVFSQKWSKFKNATPKYLVDISFEIKEKLHLYLNKGDKNEINTKLKYYQNNYTAIALRASYQNNLDQYAGFDNLLKITYGFPRHILTILRNIYKMEIFNGFTPFVDGHKFSIKSQKISLKESSDWFYEDCISEGILGDSVAIFLDRLCELLRIDMYSDKPVECSSSSFLVDKNKLTSESKDILDWAEKTRVLIGGVPRIDRNSQRLVNSYFINGLLCPRWGLSTSRRGALNLKDNVADIIFLPQKSEEYKLFKFEFENSRNAPFEVNNNDVAGEKQLGFDL